MNSANHDHHHPPGSFYVCTETSPRCYIIQKVNVKHVDQVMSDLAATDWGGDQGASPPPPPILPWWFTPECQSQLESVEPEMHIPPPVIEAVAAGPEQLRAQLRAQLEYYFSRENLATDRYLRSQMDNDQYVQIRIIAGFPKVARLTSNLQLIVQVLRESPHLQVDELGEKVRSACKRCTIILREIPESTDKKEVEAMFDGGPRYVSLDYGLNNSWYVTFETEEATQRAFLHLQTAVKTFRDKPIFARIKTGGAPTSDPLALAALPPAVESTGDLLPLRPDSLPLAAAVVPPPNHHRHNHLPGSSNFDLGQILASYGYVPRATFRPGATVVHVTSPTTPPPNAAARIMPGRPRALHRNTGRGRGFGSAGNGGGGGGVTGYRNRGGDSRRGASRGARHRYNHYNGYGNGRGASSPNAMEQEEGEEETNEQFGEGKEKSPTSSTMNPSPSSSAHENGKPETSIDDCQYNFEASAFPTLTKEDDVPKATEAVSPVSSSKSNGGVAFSSSGQQRSWAISFSSVAAGRASARSVDERWLSGQQPPPKKSYAQTLKQCSSEHLAGFEQFIIIHDDRYRKPEKQWAQL